MRCCYFWFFFICVVVFVQIRLRQQRDSFNFPRKFAVTYAVEGKSISTFQTTQLSVVKERILYGSPGIKFANHTIKSFKGIDVSCYVLIKGEPLTFHTIKLLDDEKAVREGTVFLNTHGVGHIYLKNEFLYLNPSFSISHTFDNHMSGTATKNSTASGFIEIRNLQVVVDKDIGLQWIQV